MSARFIEKLCYVLLFIVSSFLGLSLISFSPTDPSLLYDDSRTLAYANWCGKEGAFCSGVLVSSFGGLASFIFLLFLFIAIVNGCCLCSCSCYKHCQINRCIGFVLLILTCAALSAYEGVDFFTRSSPGGLIGGNLCDLISSLKSVFLERTFLLCFLWASLVLIVGFEWLIALEQRNLVCLRFTFFSTFIESIHYVKSLLKASLEMRYFPTEEKIEELVEEIVEKDLQFRDYFDI
jgi:hypothetical protein